MKLLQQAHTSDSHDSEEGEWTWVEMQGKTAPTHPLWLCTSRDTSWRLYLSSPGPMHHPHTRCTPALGSCFCPWYNSTDSTAINHKKNPLTSSLAWKRYSLPSVNLERKHHHKFSSVLVTLVNLLVQLQYMSRLRAHRTAWDGAQVPNAPNNPCCSHTRGSSGLWTCSGWCLCSHVATGSVFALSGTSFLCCKTHHQSLFNTFKRKKAAPRVFMAPVKTLQNSAAALLL